MISPGKLVVFVTLGVCGWGHAWLPILGVDWGWRGHHQIIMSWVRKESQQVDKTYSGAQRPARGVGARLPPRWPPAHACAASGTCARRLSPVTRRACDSGRPAPRLAWPALWPALAASPRWPSCWCAPRGRALTQEPSGITVRTLARREERPQRTSGRSGTAADFQERSDWQSPRAGVRGREASMARAERSGAGACLWSPSGGDEVRQGVASVRARCRADGGPEPCLAAQCEAGAVRR